MRFITLPFLAFTLGALAVPGNGKSSSSSNKSSSFNKGSSGSNEDTSSSSSFFFTSSFGNTNFGKGSGGSGNSGPDWELSNHGVGTKTSLPPPSVTNQFPQFNASQWEAYHCLTLDKILETVIPPCAQYCEVYTLDGPNGVGKDGCHPDDFPCHCANSQKISDVIEPCIFPWLNSSATCTTAELGIIQIFVTDSCQFYNATQYADYHGCSADINQEIYSDIRAGTAPTPSLEAQKFSP